MENTFFLSQKNMGRLLRPIREAASKANPSQSLSFSDLKRFLQFDGVSNIGSSVHRTLDSPKIDVFLPYRRSGVLFSFTDVLNVFGFLA